MEDRTLISSGSNSGKREVPAVSISLKDFRATRKAVWLTNVTLLVNRRLIVY